MRIDFTNRELSEILINQNKSAYNRLDFFRDFMKKSERFIYVFVSLLNTVTSSVYKSYLNRSWDLYKMSLFNSPTYVPCKYIYKVF